MLETYITNRPETSHSRPLLSPTSVGADFRMVQCPHNGSSRVVTVNMKTPTNNRQRLAKRMPSADIKRVQTDPNKQQVGIYFCQQMIMIRCTLTRLPQWLCVSLKQCVSTTSVWKNWDAVNSATFVTYILNNSPWNAANNGSSTAPFCHLSVLYWCSPANSLFYFITRIV